MIESIDLFSFMTMAFYSIRRRTRCNCGPTPRISITTQASGWRGCEISPASQQWHRTKPLGQLFRLAFCSAAFSSWPVLRFSPTSLSFSLSTDAIGKAKESQLGRASVAFMHVAKFHQSPSRRMFEEMRSRL